jgi:outer membrane protein
MKIVAGLLFLVLLLNAKNVTVFNSLSLQDAVKMVKSNNLQIKMADFDEQIAQSDISKVNGQNFGTLDLEENFVRSNDAMSVFGFKLSSRKATFTDFGAPSASIFSNPSTFTTPPQDLNYPGYYNFYQTVLKYQIPIFTGFKLSSYKQIAKAVATMKGLDKEQLINEKVFQVKKTFYDLSLLKHTIDNLQIILGNMNTLEKTARAMINEGYATPVDLLEVESKKSNVERLLNQMQANQKLLYQYLSFLLNTQVSSIILPPQDVTTPSVNMDQILANNIDIQKARTGVTIGHNLVTASESGYYPTVGAFAQVSTADDKKFLGDADKHKAYTFGARLTWNIFRGGTDHAAVQKAKIQELQAQTRVEFAKQAIRLQVDKITTQIESYNYEISSLKTDLKLAKRIYANYEGRYREQLVSINDVIIKQSKEIEALLKLQKVRNERNERIFALEKISNGEK